MAMILSAFVESFMGVLRQLTQDEVDQLLGVSSEIDNLTSMTRLIQGVLVDAERRQMLNEGINRWVLDLKDIMYDADDVVDLCQITAKKRRVDSTGSSYAVANWWNNFLSNIRNPFFSREIASKIKIINSRMDTIVRNMPLLRLTEDGDSCSHSQRVASNTNFKTSPVFVLADLVGEKIEDDAEKLIELLTKDATDQMQKDIPIVAVEGIGGIGKTTLAKKVYNDSRIKEEFRLLIWICVSKELRSVDILKNVIREVGGGYGMAEEISELVPILTQHVAGKKFFLVLDDVWAESEKVWEGLLRDPMISGTHSSRVLVTTRDGGVALRMKAIHRHNVSRLSDEDGLSLLIKQIVPIWSESEVQHLHDIGMKLVQKCDGLPLAIKSIGGVLRMKGRSRGEWQAVLRSNVWSMSRIPTDVHKAFYLSFDDLPSTLKQCFISCSLFPEDFKFRKSNLIYFWLAEGYLQDAMNPWDMGTKYYKELLLRNLLEDTGFLYDQNECKMHDLLWAFARYFGKDENSTIREGQFSFKPEGSSKIRRLSIEGNTVNTDIIIKEKWLRTLLFFNKHEIALDDICKVVSNLRILDLRGSNISVLPASLFALQHLRYLHFGGSKISTLPNSIENLRYLVYLNCERCKQLVHVPCSITSLRELRFLSFYETNVKGIPANLKNLEKLAYLLGFKTDKNTFDGFSSLEELESLSQLVVLQLAGLENVTDINIAKQASLWKKNQLRELYFCYTSLSWNDQVSQTNEKKAVIEHILNECFPPPHLEVLRIESYFGSTLPKWLNLNVAFPNLRVLEITKCACIQELAPLGQLSNLNFLRLWGAYSIESVGQEFFWRHAEYEDIKPMSRSTTVAFPKLSELELVRMYSWKEWNWTKEEPAMPQLKKLYLIDCPQLRSFPEGLSHHATSLEHLEIKGIDKLNTVENLKSIKDMHVVDSPNLERISNLPKISYILIKKCSNLKILEYLNALQRMELVDYEMDFLPEYLTTTVLHKLTIRCSLNLLLKITSQEESGSEWLKFKHISKLNIYTEDESLYAKYQKTPFNFTSNINVNSSLES